MNLQPVAAATIDELHHAVSRRRDEWVGLWSEIVDVDSGPDDHDGISTVYDRLAIELDSLGLRNERLATDGGPPVLLGRSAATDADATRVLLVGHVDTVFPAPTAGERPFTIVDGRATGPGVADMKGGVVLMLAAIAALPEAARRGLELTVLLNGDEESASVASRPVIEQAAVGADTALVFESGRLHGEIVTARRGALRATIDITGVAAHSGVEPEAGSNAAEQAAHHLLAVQSFGRSAPTRSLTATIVSAGSRPNVVPDAAQIHLDGRFDTAADGEAIRAFLDELAEHVDIDGTTTTWSVLNERPAFEADGANDDLADRYLSYARHLAVPADVTHTGGSSDGNFAAALGVPTLDGLGPIGGGYHRPDEWSDVESLIDRAAIVASLLVGIASR